MNKTKEEAYTHFLNVIHKSWTWARLTEAERAAFAEMLPHYAADITGSYSQRYNAYNAMYGAFLAGIGYQPLGWREEVTPA